MSHKDGTLTINGHSQKWVYYLNGRKSDTGYATKPEAARAYVSAYLEANPKYKPLFEGKSWRQIFAMLQMDDD